MAQIWMLEVSLGEWALALHCVALETELKAWADPLA